MSVLFVLVVGRSLPPSRQSKQGLPAALRFVSIQLYYRSSAEENMTDTAQGRAVKNYRKRLQQRGLARFEVMGLAADRKLVRSLAKRLAEDGPESKRLRATVSRMLSDETAQRGGIYAALRRSPMVGVGIKVKREATSGRKVDL
jgi:hypothetical protein